MTIHDRIVEFIIAKTENEYVDFKCKYYSENKKYDVIKDIVALSNNTIPQDKYIIFGVQDKTWIIVGINEELPDASQLDELLRVYVEPSISVEIGSFEYSNKTIGYIRIPNEKLDRPYVVAKEYTKNNKTFLRKGEIYVRRGATNFIANRVDIDSIYENKGALKIDFYEEVVNINKVSINRNSLLTGQIKALVQNNINKSVVIDEISILIHCESNFIEHKVIFIDDQKQTFSKTPNSLNQKPLQLPSGECLQKTLYFSMSEIAALNLYRKRLSGCHVKIEFHDVLGRTFQSENKFIPLRFSEDLQKKWEK